MLTSPIIPSRFVHGFTTRAGGVSDPPFDTFNLGMRWGDARENVLENRRRLLASAGASKLYLTTQVHGAGVARVRPGDEPSGLAAIEADAIVTDLPGVLVAVFVADCVPVIMADARTGACAAVHAGWRGVVAGVAASTVTALSRDLGAQAADLCVALGPSIGPCCFEVGPEVAEAFAGFAPEAVLPRSGGKPHVDMRLALTLQLQRLGVTAIDASKACTRCDPAGRFYSYRRDGGRTGQHLGFVGLRAPSE